VNNPFVYSQNFIKCPCFTADFKSAAERNIPDARSAYEQLKAAYLNRSRKHRETGAGQT
jgi:hypothetical protein